MKYTIFTAATLLVVTLLSTVIHAAPGPWLPSEPPRLICPGIILKCIPPEQIVETPEGCFACGRVPFTGP